MKYLFSVVMAVYNTERYLREAVDSLIGQDIGFDRIQLILVDDGSKDAGGAVCDKYAARYPDNIVVIHKENGGVSAARNEGLARAEGEYVNFMDSDDRMAPDAFSRVYAFYRENRTLTDVVSIPVIYFDGKKGSHPLNDKYEEGTRLIDLREDWTATQMHVASSFFVRESLTGCSFITELKYAEDAAFVQRVLLRKQALGVVADTAYHYRVRSGGARSAIQGSVNDPAWYLPRMRYWFEGTISACLDACGTVPKFVQNALMYDLQWFVARQKFLPGILTEEEEQEFLARLFRVLPHLSDDVILSARYLEPRHKYYLLTKKHGRPPALDCSRGCVRLADSGQPLAGLEAFHVDIDFITLREDACVIEANLALLPGMTGSLFIEADGSRIPASPLPQNKHSLIFGEDGVGYLAFRAEVPLTRGRDPLSLRVGADVQGTEFFPRLSFGPLAPISDKYRRAFYSHSGWCIQCRSGALCITAISGWSRVVKELLFLWELLTGKYPRRKAALLRILYWLARSFKRRPLWLISDRRVRAGDNGEAFFRYLRENHREINACFVLEKTAAAYPELKAIGRVIGNNTVAKKLLTLLSDYILSSQNDYSYFNPLIPQRDVFRDLMADRRFVFLQHGVTHNDVSRYLTRRERRYCGFVTSAHAEHDAVCGDAYGYSEEEVWLTGMPRFDRLASRADPRQITVMPTWRSYLTGAEDPASVTWDVTPDFSQSDYFRFYSALLSDERLLRAAAEHGYTIAFLPHPALQTHLDAFHFPPEIRLLGLDEEYRTVYAESALVVTDYSSAVFDFAYLEKPVLYAQFDKDRFFSDHGYRKGYFDYERDGFGEVEYDLASTVDRILEYMRSGCAMKPQYRQRVENFFAFRDRDNCRRLYERMTGS